ncbi:MAG: nitroreductase family protein [Candidatus Thorarchaeota archaeon]
MTRKTIRKYKNESVSDDIVQNILEAGRRSPSATNAQPWHFIVVRDQTGKDACSYMGYNRFTGSADFVVVGLYRKSEVVMEHLAVMDVTIALQNMVTAAWVQGVGSCWIGAFDEAKLKQILNLPEDAKIVGLVPFGIPDHDPPKAAKKPLDEIVHFDKW